MGLNCFNMAMPRHPTVAITLRSRLFTKIVISSRLFDWLISFKSNPVPNKRSIVQIILERPSAQILPFTLRPPRGNRLTVTDRIQAAQWEASHAYPAGARLEIHDRRWDDAPEVGDYIGIYRADDRWAVWGVARNGATITVWHGPSGADLGSFNTMAAALAAVCISSIQPRARRKKA
jgi:hypothetical protein